MAKAKRRWYAGKTVNPAFQAESRAHALECPECSSPTYVSKKEHEKWRTLAEEHLGRSLPSTFLGEGPQQTNRNLSKVQGNWRLDLEAKKYDKDDEEE